MKALTLAFLFATATASAQPPITKATFDPKETYALQFPTANYKHPDGHNVSVIVVKALSTDSLYRVAVRSEYLEALKPGDEVVIKPKELHVIYGD